MYQLYTTINDDGPNHLSNCRGLPLLQVVMATVSSCSNPLEATKNALYFFVSHGMQVGPPAARPWPVTASTALPWPSSAFPMPSTVLAQEPLPSQARTVHAANVDHHPNQWPESPLLFGSHKFEKVVKI